MCGPLAWRGSETSPSSNHVEAPNPTHPAPTHLGVRLEDAAEGVELAVELRLQVDRLLREAAHAADHRPVQRIGNGKAGLAESVGEACAMSPFQTNKPKPKRRTHPPKLARARREVLHLPAEAVVEVHNLHQGAVRQRGPM